MNNVTAAIRMLLFVAGTLVIVPLIIVIKAMKPGLPPTWLWHAYACLVFGIKLRFIGEKAKGDIPTVFVSNHLSYLDIIALGSSYKGVFVAKSEVANWPVFGFLSKLQNTIFIRRTREALSDSTNQISDVLRDGYDVTLFAEGTSTDGRAVKPFKASLFEMFYSGQVRAQIQPVALVLEEVSGKRPDDQTVRDIYSWWRPETTLAPHLWAFAKAGGAQLAVHYLPVLDIARYADRKALAEAAHKAVAQVVDRF